MQKPINACPRLKINQGVYFNLNSQMLFNTDIQKNVTLEEGNLEKQN